MASLARFQDTIVALATPWGESALGVLRLSGDEVFSVADRLIHCPRLSSFSKAESHRLYYGFVREANTHIDEVLVAVMRAPHSYTGEHVVEISSHGNPLILRKILDLCVLAGARLALPGEFTQRAFVHGKKDLAQAEAVADVIQAKSEEAVKAAVRQLEGHFSKAIQSVHDKLDTILVYLEAELDFVEEQIDFLSEATFRAQMQVVLSEVERLQQQFRRTEALRHGLNVVLTGRPNVGKSSIFNSLLKTGRSIVTAIPGTTRDVVDAWVTLEGLPFRFVDTAGLREAVDPIEQEGVARSYEQVRRADIVCFVWTAHEISREDIESWQDLLLAVEARRIIVVVNQMDRVREDVLQEILQYAASFSPLLLSAKTGQGIVALEKQLVAHTGVAYADSSLTFFINERQKQLLDQIVLGLQNVQALPFSVGHELMVCHLKDILRCLGEILGQTYDEDILGKIFARFCIGK